MNWYFYRIFLPLNVLGVAAIWGVYKGYVLISAPIIFTSWFLLGPIGIGLGFHRLFSHRQFETWRPLELIIAFLGTLAAYAPILFWVSNHQYHHKKSDEAEDLFSPKWHGFWQSFLWARLRKINLEKIDIKNFCSRRILVDPKLRWLSRHFTKTIWFTIILLAITNINLLVNLYLFPVLIEHFRINIINSLSHMKIPFSYRNYQTSDQSYNNFVLGYLTMGFAWHNNHHHNERKLSLRHNWWELDVEGLLGWFISKDRNIPFFKFHRPQKSDFKTVPK